MPVKLIYICSMWNTDSVAGLFGFFSFIFFFFFLAISERFRLTYRWGEGLWQSPHKKEKGRRVAPSPFSYAFPA